MPPPRDYVPSYYAQTRNPSPERAALTGAVHCDVCVVGGGIAGCSTALHLAERGYRVVLLEQERIGWGASGRSGAQALAGVAAGETKLASLVGDEDTRRIWDMTVEGLALMKSLIARHHIDCDYVAGQMHVAIKARQEAELRAWLDTLRERFDYHSARFVAHDELRSIVASERYRAALYDTNSGHLHPLNYTLGLAAAAERAGAIVHERTRALAFDDGARVVIRTEAGQVHADSVALCGNAYLGETAPALKSRIMAVGTYIVATAPLGEQRAVELISNNAAVTDINWVLDYFRRSADHRLLFGGRVSYSGLDPFDTAKATRARMLDVFPQLGNVTIDHAWGGYVDITMNRAPHFGRLSPNVYFLQGFSGHGIVLAGVAGKLLAEAVAGTAERFDVFARIPHRAFPGGDLLRRPALVLAMAYYRLRDLL